MAALRALDHGEGVRLCRLLEIRGDEMRDSRIFRSGRLAFFVFVVAVVLFSAGDPVSCIKAGLVAGSAAMLVAWVLYVVDYFRGDPRP